MSGMVANVLTNSEVRIHDRQDDQMSLVGLVQPGRPLLLFYPSSGAVELTANFTSRLSAPVNLIVPDPSWRQITTFVRREPGLRSASGMSGCHWGFLPSTACGLSAGTRLFAHWRPSPGPESWNTALLSGGLAILMRVLVGRTTLVERFAGCKLMRLGSSPF